MPERKIIALAENMLMACILNSRFSTDRKDLSYGLRVSLFNVEQMFQRKKFIRETFVDDMLREILKARTYHDYTTEEILESLLLMFDIVQGWDLG